MLQKTEILKSRLTIKDRQLLKFQSLPFPVQAVTGMWVSDIEHASCRLGVNPGIIILHNVKSYKEKKLIINNVYVNSWKPY